MNRALIKVSLRVIGAHFFDDKVKVMSAIIDSDDARQGTITLLLEGDDLPPAPPEGGLYAIVSAEITEERAENSAPPPSRRIRFVRS